MGIVGPTCTYGITKCSFMHIFFTGLVRYLIGECTLYIQPKCVQPNYMHMCTSYKICTKPLENKIPLNLTNFKNSDVYQAL